MYLLYRSDQLSDLKGGAPHKMNAPACVSEVSWEVGKSGEGEVAVAVAVVEKGILVVVGFGGGDGSQAIVAGQGAGFAAGWPDGG